MNRITEEQAQIVVDAYTSGATAQEAAAKVGFSKKTGLRVLEQRGIAIRRPSRKISAQEKAVLVDTYLSGSTMGDAADKLGVSRKAVRNALKIRGEVTRKHLGPKPLFADNYEDMISQYISGDSSYKIAKRFGCTKTLVLQVLKRNQVPIRQTSTLLVPCKKCGALRCSHKRVWKKRTRTYRVGRRNLPGSHTLAEWEQLCQKYDHQCLCCGNKAKLTVDHIIPISKPGSTNSIENIQPLCLSCNSAKCDRVIDYRPDKSCIIRKISP